MNRKLKRKIVAALILSMCMLLVSCGNNIRPIAKAPDKPDKVVVTRIKKNQDIRKTLVKQVNKELNKIDKFS